MKNRPLLSINIAVFNLEKYIKQCLDSILSQSFTDYEIILVDNGSTDGSIQICEEYAKKYDKIKYVKLPLPTVIGRPFAYARNNYVGQYFMTVDGDDYLMNGALQNIANAIEKSGHADLIMGTFVCDVEEGMTNFKDADLDENKINNVPYRKVLPYLTTLPNFHTFQWRFVLNRQLFDSDLKRVRKKLKVHKNEIYSRYNDGIAVTGYIVFAKSIWFIKEPFYVYRRRNNSLSVPVDKGKHALDFMKTVIAIAKSYEKILKQIYSYRKKYIYQMLEARFEMFRELMIEMKQEELEQLGMLLEKNKKTLLRTKNVSNNMKEFCKDITDSKSVKQGIAKYRDKEEQKVMQKVEVCRGKKVYVFPTGMCGESLCALLKKNDIKVEAFLDNDKMKTGKFFENTECRLPSVLENEDKIEECCVFIATAYRKNINIMKEQMLSYGVLEENIKIR